MKNRCLDKGHKNYHRYGGVGITVCQDWLNDYKNFIRDMGNRPSKEYSIDRIDSTGNYSKENCRWATRSQQALNKKTRISWACGEACGSAILNELQVRVIRRTAALGVTIRELAELFGLSYAGIYDIVKRRRWRSV